jgi:ribosomal protein S18 acetylase RimI-like enzyme
VGIARYERLVDDEAVADVAVAVDPAWRRVGLATAMLQLLGEAALDRRVERFTLEFLHDNVDVASILKESGLPFARRQAAGVVEAEVALTTDDAPQPAGSAPRV